MIPMMIPFSVFQLLLQYADAAVLEAQWPLGALEPIPGTSPLPPYTETSLEYISRKLKKRDPCYFDDGGFCDSNPCCWEWKAGAGKVEGSGFCCEGKERGGGCCGNGCCQASYHCAWADG